MPTSHREIHHAVDAHLRSLHEVAILLSTASKPHATVERLAKALDWLCGAVEDIHLQARVLPNPRHRFVLHVLAGEAETVLGALPAAWISRGEDGFLAIDRGAVEESHARDAHAFEAELRRFRHARLIPFLVAWGRPAGFALAAMAM